MFMSPTLEDCLRRNGSSYEILQHPHTGFSMGTAEAAHISGDRLAKTIILQDEEGYIAVVLPATCHLHLEQLSEQTCRELALASEDEVRELFQDCEAGAVPPVAMAYGLPTYLDESLLRQPDIYFEAGDHEALVHMDIGEFLELMTDAQRVQCAYRMH